MEKLLYIQGRNWKVEAAHSTSQPERNCVALAGALCAELEESASSVK